MAVNVASSTSFDTTAEESAVRAEIRQMLSEVERLHQKMQADEKRAETAYRVRQEALDRLKSDMNMFFDSSLSK